MKRKIIALVGYAGAGKDAAALALIGNGFVRVSFADALREAVLIINPWINNCGGYPLTGGFARLSWLIDSIGWNEAKKNPEVRRLLQIVGTEAGRDIHGEDCWTDIAADKISAVFADGRNVVITDCRFENEVHALRRVAAWDNHAIKFVRINRESVGPVNGHVSETGIDKIACDFQIANNGTLEQLHKQILDIAGIQL